jgi:hypothetical protein
MSDSMIRSTENQWLNFSNFLTNTFKSQFGLQSDIFKTLTSTLTDQLTNPHGFSQATLAALRGGMTDNVSTQFNNARQNIQAGQAARGNFGGDVKSGIDAQISGQLAGQQAGAQASGLDTIEQQDAQLKQENQWRAVQGLETVAQEENPQSFAGLADNAANTTLQAGMDAFQQDQSSFGNVFKKSFASGLGNVLSGNAIFSGSGGAGAMRMLSGAVGAGG